jgi:lipoprotein-anchoring transpeptidase ErfK/SrfK
MRGLLIGLSLAIATATAAPAAAQPVPNPGQAPLRLDTEMDKGTGARREAFERRPVFYRTNERPGTIIVDTSTRYLYLIKGNNVAIRYGIGVGREGFQWAGLLRISRKAEWPDWTPPDEMIERQPYLPRWMAGGPGNPLGARALYLGATVYRVHGTNQPETIGHAVSSGCFRLVNDDVVHLYEQVAVGDKVIVRH